MLALHTFHPAGQCSGLLFTQSRLNRAASFAVVSGVSVCQLLVVLPPLHRASLFVLVAVVTLPNLQEMARNFAKTEMIPRAVHHDRTGEYPMEVFKKGELHPW